MKSLYWTLVYWAQTETCGEHGVHKSASIVATRN